MRRCGLFDDAMREERSVAHCVDFSLLLIDVQFPIIIMVNTRVNKTLLPMNFIIIFTITTVCTVIQMSTKKIQFGLSKIINCHESIINLCTVAHIN